MFTLRVVPVSLNPRPPTSSAEDDRSEASKLASTKWSPCPIEGGMRRSRLPRSLLGTPLVKQDGVRTELGRLSERICCKFVRRVRIG